MRSNTRPALVPTLLLALLLSAPGCGSPIPEPGSGSAISENAFVDAIVALRRAALVEESGTIPPDEAERILSEQGVTPEELRRFVEVRGGRAPDMSEVWTRIEARLTGQDPGDLDLDSTGLDTMPVPGQNLPAPEAGPGVPGPPGGGPPSVRESGN